MFFFIMVHSKFVFYQPVHFVALELSGGTMNLVSFFSDKITCAWNESHQSVYFSFHSHSFIVFAGSKNNKSTSLFHYQNVINLIVCSAKTQKYCSVFFTHYFYYCYSGTSFSVIQMKTSLLLNRRHSENNKLLYILFSA